MIPDLAFFKTAGFRDREYINNFVFYFSSSSSSFFIDKYFSRYITKHKYSNIKVNICHRHDACWHILPIKSIAITIHQLQFRIITFH